MIWILLGDSCIRNIDFLDYCIRNIDVFGTAVFEGLIFGSPPILEGIFILGIFFCLYTAVR